MQAFVSGFIMKPSIKPEESGKQSTLCLMLSDFERAGIFSGMRMKIWLQL